MNKAVFLDRDGTVIKHVHYVTDPDKVAIVPGGVEALKKLKDRGFLLVVVSNQSLVGRGYGTAEDVEAVNARMLELLAEGGVTIDCIKYCPHRPDDKCPNRKPNPGMLLEAARELDINLAQSVMIGDNITDVEAGGNAGCSLNVLLGAGEGSAGFTIAKDLPKAAETVLAQTTC